MVELVQGDVCFEAFLMCKNKYVTWEKIATQILFHGGVFLPQVIPSWEK